MINVAVLGYGTVGSGVVEVLTTNSKVIAGRVGEEINVKYVLDLRDFEGDPIQEKIVHDYDIILNDPEVKIVIEVMGGVEPAYTFVKKALQAGKSACTSNKALVAAKGAELLKIAEDKNINFLFEASCGGGIPIIRPLNTSVTGDVINEVSGILNGTTNFMLTKMAEEGTDFDEALKTAQSSGYAEADPTADIEGHDPCRKIAILSSIAFGATVDFEKISTEGISKITATDISYAKKMGLKIKLLATCKRKGDKYFAMVAPFLVNKDNPLYNVDDVYNAVFVTGNMLGDAMFYGSGAGKLPTASAVVGDVIDIARNQGRTLPMNWDPDADELSLSSMDSAEFKYFVRTSDKPSRVNDLFGNAIEKIEPVNGLEETAFITPVMTEKAFNEAFAGLEGTSSRLRLK